MSNGLEQHFTAEERALLDRRKSGEFTPKQSLELIELQTRWHLYAYMADGPEREGLLEACHQMSLEMDDADFVNGTMTTLNALGQRAMALHASVVQAAKAAPK